MPSTSTPIILPCQATAQASAARSNVGPTIVLTAAAIHTGTVTVLLTRAPAPRCIVLQDVSSAATLQVGDRTEFVANDLPTFTTPNASRVVTVSSRPGPTESFGGLSTPHVIVVLTAVGPGSVSFYWTDCSGTAC
jgi:hypothetical protein